MRGFKIMKKRKALLMLSLAGLLTFTAPVMTASAAWKTTSAGTMYTQTASPGYVTGLVQIGNYWYYFNSKGIMQTGLQKINKKLYYFSAKGIMQKGWIRTSDKSYYANENGVLAVSKWVGNYYFQADGSMATNQWIGGKWVGADGKYTGVKNNVGWVTDGGKTYYYDSNSKMVKGWLKLDGKTYYLHPTTGVLQKGWLTINGSKYYAGPSKGVILKKQWLKGKYLKASGAMATGWTKIGKKTYYFDSNGVKQTGWIKHNKKYYYFNAKGLLLTNSWVDKNYYVGSDGARASGWTKIGTKTYYFKPSTGKKVTGWLTVNKQKYWINKNGVLQKKRWLWSKKYYASSSGAILKGLNAISGSLYYFDTTTGAKITKKKVTLGNDTYYFQKSGAAIKNQWVKISGKYYYFKADGKMSKNTWVGKYYVGADGARTGETKTTGWSTINGKKYYFDSNGNMVTGFQKISNNTYYFNSSGVMLTGLLAINGSKYYFYSDGHMAYSVTLIIGTKQYTINGNGIITAEESIKISGTTTGAKIVNFALQYVGNPYVYGGTSLTNGADCSGFVQTVFAHFGIKLLRVAQDQMTGPSTSYINNQGYKKAVVVDISSIQPGDLLFYGSGNYASHVAIYMGNGQIVHASNSQPYPKGGIKVSNYNYQTPLKAVRYWS